MTRFRRMPRLALLFALLFMPVATHAEAQDTIPKDQAEAAKRYLEIADMKKMMQQAIPKMAQAVGAQLKQRLPNISQDALTFFQKRLMERMILDHWEEFESTTLRLMSTHFTVEELNALTKFFGSPVGRSVMSKFPTYTASVQTFIGKWMQENLRSAMKAAAEDTRKQGFEFKLPR